MARRRPRAAVLTLILAESELELVPDGIKHHPAVRSASTRRGQRPSRALLDASVHHDALKGYPDGERRGRPDLAHFFLVLGLDSVLNKQGGLRLLIHTRNDELIRVSRETRIMRNQPRFFGLMEQLFHFRVVPKDPPLLRIEEGWTLERVVREEAKGPVVVLSEEARRVNPHAYFSAKAKEGDLTLILGGFAKGPFRSPVAAFSSETVSLYPESLSIWTVMTEVLSAWEDGSGYFDVTN